MTAQPPGTNTRQKVLLPALVVLLAAALLVVAVLVYQEARATWVSDSPHEELLGISDGGQVFNDEAAERDPRRRAVMQRINRIQKRIQQENQRVATEKGTYVRMVLLMPLTVSRGADSAIPLEQIEHALQGTYTALIRVNRSGVYGDPARDRVQLLLVNQGSRQDVSERLVRKVLGVAEEEHPLVAVVGLGSSVPNTRAVAERLGAEGVPMVSAITSADGPTGLTGVRNFWSVSPSNTHYAEALRAFLDTRRAALDEDRRGAAGQEEVEAALVFADSNRDPYTNSLAAAFRRELKPYLLFPELSYRGGTLEEDIKANVLGPLIDNICTAVNDSRSPLRTVLYAGRVADFRHFAEALRHRTCWRHPLTVMTGATGFDSAGDLRAILEEANVTVLYASATDAPGWTERPADAPPEYGAFVREFERLGFRAADLADGLAIAHHDALAAAAKATRLNDSTPQPDAVAAQFGNLVLHHAVRGASGNLTFPTDQRGRTAKRMIPIRQLGENTLRNPPRGYEPYVVE